MKEINISFKELVDYIKDKDIQIEKLQYTLKGVINERNELREEKSLITNYLLEKGITLAVERNRVFELRDKK